MSDNNCNERFLVEITVDGETDASANVAVLMPMRV